ncbi:hypothetical protein [Flagellimonas pacifica]|uniref:Uncharacterized protein n=1 Tax=Flagellimonas pacifica TaxID=1247520 RepID=A0A285MTK6_9FLAO|nr:hypothetical protein [Allomuricauda parva]SNZ00023.1 hypothetical protein SAMN06265377_1840 [Allomuricauda parva]
MDRKQKQKLRDAFDSILRADYITLDKIEELDNLSEYYIDYFGILQGVLQKQDNFISGRRGTGKTTNLLRSYYECLKTIAPKLKEKECVLGDTKILPIFVDLSTCNDLFDSQNDLGLIEVHFIRQIIDSLKRQLALMFDESFLLIFKKENPALDDLDYIEKVLIEGVKLFNQRNINIKESRKKTASDSLSAKASIKDISLETKLSESSEIDEQRDYSQLRGLNVQDFLNKINDIKRKAKIDSIFVFIDEYSDLNKSSQIKFSSLLKFFLGSRIGMFFKVGVITDRYDFGEKIIVGRDIFPIPLDFNEYVERYGGAIAAMTRMQDFVQILIEKRIEIFCPELSISDVFKGDLPQAYYRITRETIGVSRTIGMILQNAYIQAQSTQTDNKIGLNEINYGISSARKTYQKQFIGSIKKKLVYGFYMDMWNAILKKALAEKAKYSDRAASHFMIDPLRKDYLNVLCENFLIHFLSENISSKHGGNYNLYSIDYDICNEHSIRYANKKDEYTPIRFVFDSVISEFDPYFLESKSKSYKCPKCDRIYPEEDVVKVKVKRCFEDDEKLVEIIHQAMPITEGNYAEVEIKILGLISQLPQSEAMTAREIADSVGCTIQKVSSWGTRVLAKNGHISIKNNRGKNVYFNNE